MVARVEITETAGAMLEQLKRQHGPLLFHQSGGCCDGSAPMCFPVGDFRVGPQDVHLGRIGGCDFYIGAAQFDYWEHTQLVIDVVPRPRLGLLRRGTGRGPLPHAEPRVHRCRSRGAGRRRPARAGGLTAPNCLVPGARP